jgi:hypothetical protein
MKHSCLPSNYLLIRDYLKKTCDKGQLGCESRNHTEPVVALQGDDTSSLVQRREGKSRPHGGERRCRTTPSCGEEAEKRSRGRERGGGDALARRAGRGENRGRGGYVLPARSGFAFNSGRQGTEERRGPPSPHLVESEGPAVALDSGCRRAWLCRGGELALGLC